MERVGDRDGLGRWVETHRGGSALILAAAVVVVGVGIKLAAPVLVPALLGAFVATANLPLVIALYRRGLPLVLTIGLALVVDALLLGGLSALLVVSVAELSERSAEYLASLQRAEAVASERLRGLGVEETFLRTFNPGDALGFFASLIGDIATGLWNGVLAIIIAAFLVFRMAKLSVDSGAASRTEGARLGRAVREMYRYIAIKTATSLVTGLFIGLWLLGMDADLPILFGLLAFFLCYIPTLGSIIAALAAVGLGLLQHGLGHATLIALGFAVVNIVIGNVVEPRVMGRVLGLWPLVILLSVLVWGWLLGVVGAVLSALLTLAVKLLLLATDDLRPLGLMLGPRARPAPSDHHDDVLLEETMPRSQASPGTSRA